MDKYEYYIANNGKIALLCESEGWFKWLCVGHKMVGLNVSSVRHILIANTYYQSKLLASFNSLDNPVEVLYG